MADLITTSAQETVANYNVRKFIAILIETGVDLNELLKKVDEHRHAKMKILEDRMMALDHMERKNTAAETRNPELVTFAERVIAEGDVGKAVDILVREGAELCEIMEELDNHRLSVVRARIKAWQSGEKLVRWPADDWR